MEDRIRQIEERNRKVEMDKKWETSLTRIGSIAVITYVSVCILLYLIGVPNHYLAALVPVAGFLLSTQSLPQLKHWWLNHRK
jgi:hypothetical protein